MDVQLWYDVSMRNRVGRQAAYSLLSLIIYPFADLKPQAQGWKRSDDGTSPQSLNILHHLSRITIPIALTMESGI